MYLYLNRLYFVVCGLWNFGVLVCLCLFVVLLGIRMVVGCFSALFQEFEDCLTLWQYTGKKAKLTIVLTSVGVLSNTIT